MVSIFEIGISQNTKCDSLVQFLKSGHILLSDVIIYLVAKDLWLTYSGINCKRSNKTFMESLVIFTYT